MARLTRWQFGRKSPARERPHIVYVIHPLTARFALRGQFASLREQGFDVTIIGVPGEDLEALERDERVNIIPVDVPREIEPLRDLRAFFRILTILRRLNPDVVHGGNPKTALLGLCCAWLLRVPVRIYTLHGLRLETTRGLKRAVLALSERAIAACAHEVLCVSPSLRDRYRELGLAPDDKLKVLLRGSANGVRAERYERSADRARTVRGRLGIGERDAVIGCVGRFTRDKGITELVDAYDIVRARKSSACLLLIGDFEAGDPIPDRLRRRIDEDPQIVYTGWVEEIAPYYSAMDVLAFPTHREGFGMSAIEAGAAELPVVGYQVTGLVDAVVDGSTGTLVARGDVTALAEALLLYLLDDDLRRRHGEAGRKRASAFFSSEEIWRRLGMEYHALLAKVGQPGSAGSDS